jgi:DNA-binding SARP family transcriptional activator/basic membrane lipoprotein Med (substrate-binding protein (PBP1-ABC) superfamily)
MEFRVLGPLEARADGRPIALGGGKQRAVLAVLLLNANEVISMERLIDEVWGDRSPPSASHSLEAYISRIRQLLNGHGPTLIRRGAGYCLELGDAVLDADTFARLLEDASGAVDAHDLERASALAVEALALWYGAALADVSLASAGRAEAERLEEHRLRAFELRFDAELGLGRHESIVGELQVLVGQNPYRERFVAQVMLALYRAGRQAEALDVYEQTRRRLDEDLGLQPSAELQQLSGQIVRQEPQLRRPMPDIREVPGRDALIPTRVRRMAALVLAGTVTAAVTAFTASGGAASVEANPALTTSAETGARVALVLPKENRYPELVPWYSEPFRASGAAWGFDTKVMVGANSGLENRIVEGGFDLVLVIGNAPTSALTPVVRQMAETKFVFLDASLADLSLEGVPNASGIRFADEQTSELAGYLSALVPRRGASRKDRVDTVSVVAGPDSAHARRVVAGFERGVARARGRNVAVRVDYVDDSNLTTCERVANNQIDAGSDVVFVDAGHCGLGALAVARLRGVWGIGGYQDGVDPGPHVLAIFYKDYDYAIKVALAEFAGDTFRAGRDEVLGLNDNYAVGVDDTNLNPVVSESIWSKVVSLCSNIRQHTLVDAP